MIATVGYATLSVANPAAPSPTIARSPSLGLGRLCFGTTSACPVCGSDELGSFRRGQSITFTVEYPITTTVYVHLVVSRIEAAGTPVIVKEFDIQAFTSPVSNELGAATDLSAGQSLPEATYRVDALIDGRLVATASLQIAEQK